MRSNWKILLKEWFRSDEERSPVWPYIFISILLHFIVVSSAWLLMQKTGNELEPQEEVVEVLPLVENGEQYEIADSAPPAVEEKPQSAKLLGMYDSAVQEESVAVERGQGKPQNSSSPQKPNLYAFDKKIFAADGAPTVNASEASQDVASPNGMQDYFPDYKRGAHTYLNVMRFPEVEYFVRMKRIFRTTWNPAPAIREYMTSNRLTNGKVEVVMALGIDKAGNIAELFVLRSSGIAAYDQEALRTIRASSPFAQPPNKFLEKDGQLRMSWTFTQYL